MNTPSSEPIRDYRATEAKALYEKLLDFSADPNAAIENYGKIAEMRELLVQKFSIRLLELAGPQIDALRQQDPKVPAAVEMMHKYIMQISGTLHALSGSTTDSAITEGLEKQVRAWIGDATFETIFKELNDEAILTASMLHLWDAARIRQLAAAERTQLQKLLNP